ncbi:MAG: DEAD/DEAH box helicase family protein [Elusimicrobia bacterium]|nr:DEAD/DEAH box helicase family protein [Elusimicrobiota bacterium]
MSLNEADTRAKLIDPAIHAHGWTEDLIRREETAGAIEIIDGKPRKRAKGRTDYILRIKINAESQPVAVALIEAKAERLPAAHGLEQAKTYAACKRMNVPFCFSSNGHKFVEFDSFSGLTSAPRLIRDFPTPEELRRRYEKGMGFSLEDPAAKPLLARYTSGEAGRRYYQDAAIRAVFEKLARCERENKPRRALLSLATGAGKTFIAVNLLKRVADAGQLRRALFVCDRDELRSQGLGAFQNIFGTDAAEVYKDAGGRNHARNARIHIATYQTLNVDTDEASASFLIKNYPENYFSHIIIDECHRSAWGKWSQVLTRNPDAVQVGLTATPRKLQITERTADAVADALITADNVKHFGEPVYEYDLGQGIEDGYLAACEIHRYDLFHDNKKTCERKAKITKKELTGKSVTNAITGGAADPGQIQKSYQPGDLESKLWMPERVAAMCAHLFERLIDTGGPEQKTIIFCARDNHADVVAAVMNNLYADWCHKQAKTRLDHYAFKCTASVGGQYLADLRGASRSHFIATTVELLTTGVDVPVVKNIVFFKYVVSPIAFYQMIGRGMRLDAPTGKLMFSIYDYTNATRLFNKEFITKLKPPHGKGGGGQEPPPPIQVEGFDIHVTDAGRYILTMKDGKTQPVTVDEYKSILAAKLVGEAPTLDVFRSHWINPSERKEMMGHLPDAGRSAMLIQKLEGMENYDLYDVLGEIGYGLAPRTRPDRAGAFVYKHAGWLAALPPKTSTTLKAVAAQFSVSGTDGLENPAIFQTPDVVRAGGLPALKALGNPADILREAKTRIFAV